VRLLLWTSQDPASLRLAEALVDLGHFCDAGSRPALRLDEAADAALAEVEGSLLAADRIDERVGREAGLSFDSALFLSKHSAASGIRTLTVHPIGNLTGEARFGGSPATLAPADPAAMTRLLAALATEGRPRSLQASFEATHHGPLMSIPSLFVEVGSSLKDWQDDGTCRLVARAVSAAYLRGPPAPPGPGALGVGGGHYQPFATDIARAEAVPVGHLIPTHVLRDVGEEALERALGCSKAPKVLFDSRKMVPDERDRYLRFFEGHGLSVREARARGPGSSPANV
jgi:D-aminoacyl-tRNA deacylase